MSSCQKTEAVSKGAVQRAIDAHKVAKIRIKTLESQCEELDSQLAAKHVSAECASGVQYQNALNEFENAKNKLDAAQQLLKVNI